MKLQITDFVKFIDLTGSVNAVTGWSVTEYRQGIPGKKGGGMWGDSPFLDGRQPVFSRRDNPIDTIELRFVGNNPDEVAAELRRLMVLLDKGVSYWTNDFQSGAISPVVLQNYDDRLVWLVVQAPCETDVRYSVVVDYSIPELNNQFGQPFIQLDGKAIIEITLVLERTIFQSRPVELITAPTEPVGFEYFDIDVGVFRYYEFPPQTTTFTTGPQYNGAGITLGSGIQSYVEYITKYDAAPPAYTNADLVFPYAMWSAAPGIGDILYVGSTQCLPPPHYLKLSAAPTGTFVVEYSQGAGVWAAIAASNYIVLNDGVNAYLSLVGLPVLTGAARDAVNGRTAYWIRYRLTVVGNNPTISAYSNMAFDMAFLKPVGGDYAALLKAYLYSYNFYYSSAPSPSRLMFALHSSSRIPDSLLYDDTYPASVPYQAARSKFIYTPKYIDVGVVDYFLLPSIGGGGGRAYTQVISPDSCAPRIECVYTAVAARPRDNAVHFRPLDLAGRFRVLVGAKATGVGAASLWELSLRDQASSGVLLLTDFVTMKIKDQVEILDFGEINWPPEISTGQTGRGYIENLIDVDIAYGGDGVNANTLYIYWVRMIPVDEFFVDVYTNNNTTLYTLNVAFIHNVLSTIVLDSAITKKEPIIAMFADKASTTDGDKETHSGPVMIASASGKMQYSLENYVAMTGLAMKYDDTTGAWYHSPSLAAWVDYTFVSRYMGIRGDND